MTTSSFFVLFLISSVSDALRQKLHHYENMPPSDEERKKCNDIVEQTVKERSRLLAQFVVSTFNMAHYVALMSPLECNKGDN